MSITSIKIFLRVPSLIYSTLTSVWLGLTVGSKKDLGSVGIICDVEQVQDVEPQEDYICIITLSP
jgi:hypothetical protein